MHMSVPLLKRDQFRENERTGAQGEEVVEFFSLYFFSISSFSSPALSLYLFFILNFFFILLFLFSLSPHFSSGRMDENSMHLRESL